MRAVQVTDELEAYLDSLLRPRDGMLARLEEDAEANDVPIVGPAVGALLQLLAATAAPRRMLELGTATGYSAVWLLRGAPEAHLVATEMNGDRAEQARQVFREARVAGRVDLHHGDALEVLERSDGTFGLIFNDLLNSFPDVATVERCFQLSVDRLEPGGLLIADNALRRGEVVKPDTRMAKNVVRWNQLVSGDERLDSTLVPLRDGVMIARVRS